MPTVANDDGIGPISKIGRRGIRSDLKGDRYERTIAKRLTTWVADAGLTEPDGLPAIFVKVPQSGGRPKQGALPKDATRMLSGDIICPEWWPFMIECKDNNSWSLDDLLYRPDKGLIRQAWDTQAVPAAESTGRHPLLIFHKSHRKDLVMLEMDLVLQHKLLPTDNMFLYWGVSDTAIMFLEMFLSLLPTTILGLEQLRYGGAI